MTAAASTMRSTALWYDLLASAFHNPLIFFAPRKRQDSAVNRHGLTSFQMRWLEDSWICSTND